MGRQRHLLDVEFVDKVKFREVEIFLKEKLESFEVDWDVLEESTCQSCVASCNSIWKAYFRFHPKMFTLMLFLDLVSDRRIECRPCLSFYLFYVQLFLPGIEGKYFDDFS
jgi:hypothetical protein